MRMMRAACHLEAANRNPTPPFPNLKQRHMHGVQHLHFVCTHILGLRLQPARVLPGVRHKPVVPVQPQPGLLSMPSQVVSRQRAGGWAGGWAAGGRAAAGVSIARSIRPPPTPSPTASALPPPHPPSQRLMLQQQPVHRLRPAAHRLQLQRVDVRRALPQWPVLQRNAHGGELCGLQPQLPGLHRLQQQLQWPVPARLARPGLPDQLLASRHHRGALRQLLQPRVQGRPPQGLRLGRGSKAAPAVLAAQQQLGQPRWAAS